MEESSAATTRLDWSSHGDHRSGFVMLDGRTSSEQLHPQKLRRAAVAKISASQVHILLSFSPTLYLLFLVCRTVILSRLPWSWSWWVAVQYTSKAQDHATCVRREFAYVLSICHCALPSHVLPSPWRTQASCLLNLGPPERAPRQDDVVQRPPRCSRITQLSQSSSYCHYEPCGWNECIGITWTFHTL